MRYFLTGFLLLCVAVVSIAGFRGGLSRKPPIEIFPDMDRQPKLRPQAPFRFWGDGRTSRLPVAGTIASTAATKVGDEEVFPYEDHPYNTGKIVGTTNFVELSPVPVNEALLVRGQERFQISCLPCHGAQADGKGITTKFGMAVVANLHDPRIVRQGDGEIFNTITYGKGLMGAYGANVAVGDRWAIVTYLRALQRSRLGSSDDVPADMMSMLPNAAKPTAAQPTK